MLTIDPKMTRRAFPLVLALLLGLLVAGIAPVARAQDDATPAAESGDGDELPEGVTSEFVAYGPGLPGTGDLVIFRLKLEPGAVLPPDPSDPTNVLIVVEAGEVTLHVEVPVVVIRAAEEEGQFPTEFEEVAAGEGVTLGVGDSVAVPGLTAGEVRNEGDEAAVLLVAGADPSSLEDAAAGDAKATPAP